jgi:hypothetical protein
MFQTYAGNISAVIGPIQCHRCHNLVVTKRGHKSDRFLGHLWYIINHPRAKSSTAVERHHVCADCRLINKDRRGRSEQALLSDPAPAYPRVCASNNFTMAWVIAWEAKGSKGLLGPLDAIQARRRSAVALVASLKSLQQASRGWSGEKRRLICAEDVDGCPSRALRDPCCPDLPSPSLPAQGPKGARERCSTSCRSMTNQPLSRSA